MPTSLKSANVLVQTVPLVTTSPRQYVLSVKTSSRYNVLPGLPDKHLSTSEQGIYKSSRNNRINNPYRPSVLLIGR